MRQHLVPTCNSRLLIGVTVGQQLPFTGYDEGVSLVSDADAINHPPQLFEIQPTDEPPFAGIVVESNGDDRGRQEIVVNREVRHEGAFDVDTLGPWHFRRGCTETTRDHRATVVVEE